MSRTITYPPHRYDAGAVRRRVLRRARWAGFWSGLAFRRRSADDVAARCDLLAAQERKAEMARCEHPDGYYDAPQRYWLWCPDCRDYIERPAPTTNQEAGDVG